VRLLNKSRVIDELFALQYFQRGRNTGCVRWIIDDCLIISIMDAACMETSALGKIGRLRLTRYISTRWAK
jgi:hypothetical protein